MLGSTYIKVNRFDEFGDYIQTYDKAICDTMEDSIALVTYDGGIIIIDQDTGYMLANAPTISKARQKVRSQKFQDALFEARCDKEYDLKIKELRDYRSAQDD